MPLTVSPVTEQDLPTIVAIDDAAMSGGPLPLVRQTLCGFPSHASYLSDILATLRTNFAKRAEQDMHYYKVTDAENDDIICFCVWKIHDTTRSPHPPSRGTRAQPLRPSNFPQTSLSAYVALLADDLRADYFPDESYLFFEMLMTAPAHQRRGAGRLLIKHALEMADARGILVSAGQGSEHGIGLYKRCGYAPVREFWMDMRPYGVDVEHVRQWLLVRRVEGDEMEGGRGLESKL
ncbi:acyl-coa n-acyltransferase [Rhypophila decipiens]